MTRPASVLSHSRRAGLLAACAGAALIWSVDAQALPTGAAVEAGTATVTANGAKEVDVNQSSQRAFIDWSSFNLSPDEIVAFKQALGASSITFNRVNNEGLTTIGGQITAPGAVWLFTPSGLIVGPTAKINVGAFVASTGNVSASFGPSGPSGPGTFHPLTDNAVQIFGATAPIEVQAGATINASNGFVALNSEQVTQNGQVTATDAVAFALADGSKIAFTTGNATGAVQQLGAIDVSAAEQANAQLTLGGSTKGAWVQVAAPDEAGPDSTFAGVINLTGVVQATGIAPSGTDKASVMLVGVDNTVATPIDVGNHSFSLDASSGSVTAGNGGLYFVGSSADLGAVAVKGAVDVDVTGALTLGQAVSGGDAYLSGGSITVDALATLTGAADLESADSVTVAGGGGVVAAGAMTVNAGRLVSLGAGSVLRADSAGAGSNALTLQAAAVVADASSVIAAGPASKAPTSDLSITTNQGMTLGEVDGGDVELQSNGGDIDLLGPSTASLLFNAQAPTGSVLVAANISSQGSIDIGATSTITVNAGVSVKSNLGGAPKGGITLDADALQLDPTSSLIAGPTAASPIGDVELTGWSAANVGQVAAHNLDIRSWGNVTLAGDIGASGHVSTHVFNGEFYQTPDTVTVAGSVKVVAGGLIDLESVSLVSLGAGSLLQSDTAGAGGDIWLESFAIDAAPTSQVAAGPLAGPGADTVTVYADGGDLKMGKVIGTDVYLEADGAFSSCPDCGFGESAGPVGFTLPGGSVYLEGDVKPAGRFDAISDFADVHADGNVTATGAVNLNAAGDILGAANIRIIGDTGGSGSKMTLTAGGGVDLDPTSALQNGASAAAPTGAVKVTANDGDIATGAVSGTDIELTTAGELTVGGAVYGSSSVTFDPADVTLNASVTSGGAMDITADNAIILADGVTVSAADHLTLTATTIATGKNATLQSDSDGDGAGDLNLTATSVTGGATLIAGKDATHPSAAITADASEGGLALGGVTGDVVSLTAGAGDVSLAGPSTTGASLTITAIGGGIGLSGSVTGAGTIDLTADNVVTLGAGVTVSAGDHLNLTGSTLTAGKGATLQSDSDGDGHGDMTLVVQSVTGGVNLIAGKDATHPSAAITADASAGGLDLGGVTGDVVALTGEAGDVTLAGASSTGASLTIKAVGGGIGLSGSVSGAGTIDLTADNAITVAPGAVVSAADHLSATAASISVGAGGGFASDSDKDGVGALTLSASGDITFAAGGSASAHGADASIISSGGGLTLAGVSGAGITLSSAKDLALGGAIQASGALSATSTGGQIQVQSSLASGGDMDLHAHGALSFAAATTVSAGGHLDGEATAITLGAGGTVASDAQHKGGGRALTLHAATGDITAGAGSLIDGGAAAANVTSDQGAVTLAAVSGASVDISAARAASLNGAVSATGAIDVTAQSIAVAAGITGGRIDLESGQGVAVAGGVTLKADGDLKLNAGGPITLAANDHLQGDAGGTGVGGVFLYADSVAADATSQLLAGASAAKPTGQVDVQANGDIHLGQAAGDQVYVYGGGDVVLAGAVQGVHGVFVDPGDLTILANMTSGGAIYLATGSGGALTIGSGVSVTSTGDQVVLMSAGDLTIGSNASVTGVSLLADTQGVLRLASGATLATTGQATAPTWPIVPASVVPSEGPPTVHGLNIAAAGLDLQGTITAGSGSARDDVYVMALGQPSAVVVGGADSTSGFHLSNAAVGHITARNLIVMAGGGEGGANADIQVQDLTLNTGQLGALALGTDSSHAIAVTGRVALQGGGSTDLHLGFAVATTTTVFTDNPDAPNGSPQTVLTGYIPGEIDVSGSLGSAAAPFASAMLLARDDIFMGSADFIAAAKADAGFDAGKSSSAYAIDTDHVFLASHDLELGAQGRVVQQNTGGPLRYAGLVFDTPTAGHELVANPTALDGKDLGAGNDGGGWTPNYAAGPTRVDVFGKVTRPNGTSTSSVDAAREPNLSAPAIADVSHYKINTCVFATTCLTAPPPRIEVPTDEIVQAQAAADASTASSTQTPTGFAQTIQIDDTSDDDKSANGAPVTGSGNGDLWTGPPSAPH